MRLLTAAIVVLVFASQLPTATAATLLRWKLQPGQRFQVQVTQNSKTETTVNNRTVKMSLDLLMDMTWAVDSVDQQGAATVSQMFTRIQVNMDAPSVGKVSFDTAKKTKPGELTEGMAEAIGPLINAKFSVKMTPRGKITEVEIPKETVAAIKKATTTSKLRQLLSVEGLTQLLRQSLATLPEAAIEPGEQWERQTTTPSPLGRLHQTHKYTYRGTVDREGKPIEKIDVATNLSLEPSKDITAKKLTVKKHEQTGTLYFDDEAGRFVATETHQSIDSERPFRDLRIVVSVDTISRTEISPLDSPANSQAD